jgi:hypothetical protein
VALQHGRAPQDLRHVNQIDQKPVAALRIDGGGADGPRGLRHIFRPRQAEAGWLSSRSAGTHPAADVAPVLSGCLAVSEPKVCHGRFWRVVRAWSMITEDVQIVDI